MNCPKALFLWIALSLSPGALCLGSGWSVQSSNSHGNLHGVDYIDANTWIAVGDGGTILRSTDGGVGWSPVASPVVDHLRGVSFRENIGLAVGLSGQVLRSTNGGLDWVQETRPTSKNLYAVSIGDSIAVITGEEGTILVSSDAGVNWSPRTAGTASVIFGVSVCGSTAVGVGGQAAIVNSDNNGRGWGLQVLGPPTQLFFYATSFPAPSTGWAVGSYQPTGSIIIKTTQFGFVWTPQTAPTTDILFGVSFVTVDTGTAVGASGSIVHTTDGGRTWLSQQSGTTHSLGAVSFFDARTGIAVGDSGTILRTTDGGLTGVANQIPREGPRGFQLEQNYPNPFNPQTGIRFQVSGVSHVRLSVYDLLGREVAVLMNEQKPAGSYEVSFNAAGLSSGVYIYRLTTGRFRESRKMILMR